MTSINRKTDLRGNSLGKGVDIGTAFISCAEQNGDKVMFRNERDAFFEVQYTKFTKNMLNKAGVRYIKRGDHLYVVGNSALEFANLFHKDTRRPLSRGVINPAEKESLPMIEVLIAGIVGKPRVTGEVAYFSVPGAPIDADFNSIYHEKVLQKFLGKLGYDAFPINEGQAVVLSELHDEGFSGLGLSFGGGMVNACLSYMSVPCFSFSVTKAGDWIDQQVAMATNETTSQICAVKESSLNLSTDIAKDNTEDALSIYYNYLIEYVLENIKEVFENSKDRPNLNNPIPIVLAGGTTKPQGFATRFTRLMKQIKLPFPVSSVRMAREPLKSVAKGALVAARAHGEED
ncbi:MAG: hypothetical protein NOU37_00500 [Candidatus Brocadiales bacterium]|nr:hypothetical protein [Candidatus Bathyanammoxibius amoris]